MRRIRLIIEYDGTNYVGWQTQPNGVAVQQVIETELFRVTGDETALHGSGRTDSGVHALSQVAHFDTSARMPADKFAFALNAGLPRDIRIRYSGEAEEDFHARFSAKRKQYRYTVQAGEHARVFLRNTALHVHGKLDEDVLHAMAKDALGSHDFRAFMAANTTIEQTVRKIYRSEWTRDGELLYYDVEGNGFLYNMVRILVGTMLSAAKGTLPPDAMQKALRSCLRQDAGPTAPAHGLTLMRVVYPGFDTAEVVRA
ncbi:MAG TPA: tRNA pseudouridine(38-40) synthase TruA [Feifaniaceae bacterium]|nr:tRNA pseudouridine(38-40) synthase TruA [Feifaniaceae bacterium]